MRQNQWTIYSPIISMMKKYFKFLHIFINDNDFKILLLYISICNIVFYGLEKAKVFLWWEFKTCFCVCHICFKKKMHLRFVLLSECTCCGYSMIAVQCKCVGCVLWKRSHFKWKNAFVYGRSTLFQFHFSNLMLFGLDVVFKK